VNKLSSNQRKLLINLAKHGEVKEPSSQQFLSLIGMSSASVRQSLKVLLGQDMVCLGKRGGYKVLDPLFKEVLRK
jgi:DNA-binding transcriptional ArsR family regulator